MLPADALSASSPQSTTLDMDLTLEILTSILVRNLLLLCS